MRVGGTNYNAGTNDIRSELDIIEATPTRVRVRQESFYENNGTGSDFARSQGHRALLGLSVGPGGTSSAGLSSSPGRISGNGVRFDTDDVGALTPRAQQRYTDSGYFPELLAIYHLLGDPAMTLR